MVKAGGEKVDEKVGKYDDGNEAIQNPQILNALWALCSTTSPPSPSTQDHWRELVELKRRIARRERPLKTSHQEINGRAAVEGGTAH